MRWQPVAAVFRRRARDEADRYGSDPWVFVRELLQNARDAGATRVSLTVEQDGDIERVSCHDDGEGMSFAESREFLFTLYASSKSEVAGQAGQFGVGFWSVLRFEPSFITIRSQPQAGSGWQVRLDGNLETVEHERVHCSPGTEVILERPRQQPGLDERIYRAAVADARFLSCRDDSSRPLRILVNGRYADTTFALPPPSLVFQRKGLRGAVGLGRQPKVELFVHGLRVRNAVSLDELLTEDRPSGGSSRLAEIPQGLVPRVMLDSDRLEVLLARGDAREDRRLRRYIRIAECELAGLVRRQLDRFAPVSPFQRLVESTRSLCNRPRLRPLVLSLATILLVTAVVAAALMVREPEIQLPVSLRTSSWADEEQPATKLPYTDLGAGYTGPAVDPLARTVPAIDLRYAPSQPKLLFAALLISEMSEQGRPDTGLEQSQLVAYQGAQCRDQCVRVELGTGQAQGLLRLPVPTGYLVDVTSVRVDASPVEVLASPLGEPVIDLRNQQSGSIFYLVGAAPGRAAATGSVLAWPALPADLSTAAQRLQELSLRRRVRAARQLVRSLASYDRSPRVAQMYQAADQQGSGLITSALTIGAGDCDVLNTILVAVLREAGVPARLAIGYVGVGGSALPGLHAWVEALDELGYWRAVDASTVSGEGGGVAAPPAPEGGNEIHSQPPPALPRADDSPVVRGLPWLLPVMVSGAALMLVSGVLYLVLGSWTNRTVQLDQSTDLAALLSGALRQPEAFRQVQSLFSRKLIPLVGGTTISVKRARRRTAQGRLFRSRDHSRLAVKAAARGAAVVDAAQSAGEVVADLLGAYDLDHWDRLLVHRVAAPFVQTVNRVLRECGERWQVRVAGGAIEALTTLDLNALELGRRVPAKLVMIGSDTALCTAASALFATRPWQAVLMVVDAAVHHLDLPATRRSQVLSLLAGRAVAEKVSV